MARRPPAFTLTPLPWPAESPTHATTPGTTKHLAEAVHRHARQAAQIPLDQASFPELFELMVQVLADTNRRLPPGTPPDEAAKRQAVALCHYLGGQRPWIPTPGRIAGVVRDWTIYHREWTGNNARALAERHGLDLDSLYRLLKRMRELHLRALRRGRQPVHDRPKSNRR